MKKISAVLILFIILTGFAQSQYKDIPYETKQKIKNNKILGFINMDNFSLTHSFGLSYQTIGSNSVSLATYTGTVAYQIMKNMRVSADVTMQYSPYANLTNGTTQINNDYRNSLTGINLSRLSFDYKPTKDIYINFEYRNLKNGLNWYDRYNDPFYYQGY